MASYILTGLAATFLYWTCSTILSLRRNIVLAKASGLPYVISPVSGMSNYLYMAIEPLVVKILSSIPYVRDTIWPGILSAHRGIAHGERVHNELGDTFLIVSPSQIYMDCGNAEGCSSMMSRRHDFVKPTELYGIVDIFGESIVSTEGDTWKRHRKIVAPAFAEKSNKLVWEESLRQAQGMLNFWTRDNGNTKEDILVNSPGEGTAHLALNVISGAGFGVSQVFEGADENQLGKNIIQGFNTAKLSGSHTLRFADALNVLTSGVIMMMMLPAWMLENSPFDIHKHLLQAHKECADYFQELVDYKVQMMAKGDETDDRIMDIMGPLVKATQNSPEDPKGIHLTNQEVIADCWLLLFAGHETSANTLHYIFTHLAVYTQTQIELQYEIDIIMGTRPVEEWTYEKDMGQLYNSLVGACVNETLRLLPPIPEIPKVVRPTSQILTFDGKSYTLPNETKVHISAAAIQRNPRYWPHSPSKRTSKKHDLDDWVPQRWITSGKTVPSKQTESTKSTEAATIDGLENVSYERSTDGLFTPVKGSYLPFAEGARSCPGRRFAQVEITAVVTFISRNYSIELDVRDWASDADVEKMGMDERRKVYEKAKERAMRIVWESKTIIALKMMEACPLRFVKRGEERFFDCYA